jgi:(R,R)-butanediol dehydrogenase/meso-butanediol dehydrogenase/diacetyl reductase
MPSGDQNLFVLLRSPGNLEMRGEPLAGSLPGPEYVRLKVSYCALCGSDLSFYRGRPGAEYPRTLGHEYFGTIVQVGANVAALNVGDLVAVDPNYRCGECFYCQAGFSNLCESNEINLFTRRGLSRFVEIHHAYLHKIPLLRPAYLGALIEPLSCALHAIELESVQESDSILVVGGGGQGSLLSLGLSLLFPALQVDLYDIHRIRAQKIARACPTVRNLPEAPSDPKYSLVFETSGQSLGFQHAVSGARKGGRIVVISRYRNQPPAVFPEEFPCKECTVTFSHLNGNGQPFLRAASLLSQSWEERFDQLFTIRPLEDTISVFAQWDQSPFCKTIVAIDPDGQARNT